MSMDSPRYQRMRQRLATLRPEQRAILATAQNDLSRMIAEEDGRKELEARQTAMGQQQADRQHGLGRDSLGLARGQFRDQQKDARSAERLGMANMALSGGIGYLDMQNAKAKERRMDELIKRWRDATGGM